MADEATRTIEIDVPVEKFYEVITDFGTYPEILKHLGMTGVHIDKDEGNRKVVTQEVKKLGVTVSYTLQYELVPNKKVTWKLIKGQMMSANDGSWVLESAGEGRTKATYTVAVRFGFLVPKSFVNMLASKELPEMLEAFKRRAEKGS